MTLWVADSTGQGPAQDCSGGNEQWMGKVHLTKHERALKIFIGM